MDYVKASSLMYLCNNTIIRELIEKKVKIHDIPIDRRA